MKHTTLSKTAISLAITLMAAAGFATEPALPDRGPLPFETYDADGSGYVSQQEFERVRTQRIQQRAEQQRQFRHMDRASDFAAFDSDGDGRLSRQEMQTQQRERQEMRRQNRMDSPMGTGMGMGRGGMGSGGGMGGGRR